MMSGYVHRWRGGPGRRATGGGGGVGVTGLCRPVTPPFEVGLVQGRGWWENMAMKGRSQES